MGTPATETSVLEKLPQPLREQAFTLAQRVARATFDPTRPGFTIEDWSRQLAYTAGTILGNALADQVHDHHFGDPGDVIVIFLAAAAGSLRNRDIDPGLLGAQLRQIAAGGQAVARG